MRLWTFLFLLLPHLICGQIDDAAEDTFAFTPAGGLEIIAEGDFCEGGEVVLSISNESFQSVVWSNGSPENSITVYEEDVYTVEVVDDFGNTLNASYELVYFPNPTPQINPTNVTCNGGNDGYIEIFNTAGTPVDEVFWTGTKQTGEDIFELSAGDYTFTFIDIHGCQSSNTVTIMEPSPISGEVFVTNGSCSGDLGSASIEASGGTGELTITWSDGNTELPNGSYSVLIADENNCQSTIPFEVLAAEPITIEETIIDAFDGENGSISLDIEGGTPPYSVQWSDGQMGTEAINLGQGTHEFTITDDNDCVLSGSINLIDTTVPDLHEKSYRITNCALYAGQIKLQWTCFDLTGKQIDSGSLLPFESISFPERQSTGLLLYHITSDGQIFVEAIITP